MKRYTINILVLFFATIIMGITTNISATTSTTQTQSVVPISSFVMKNVVAGTNVIFEGNGQFDFIVYDANGNVVEPVEFGKYDDAGVWHKEANVKKEDILQYISKVNYTYEIKKKNVKSGYGTYEVKVKGCEDYAGVTLTKTVRLVPNVESVRMSFFFYRDSVYRIKGVSDTFHVEANYKKLISKNLDGVQYVYAKDKKFKKVYKKGRMKLTTPKLIKCARNDSGTKGKIGPTIPKIKYGKCYVKWRVYKVVNGKKVYSKWKQQHMWMNGWILD